MSKNNTPDLEEGSSVISAILGKCTRCHEGKIFKFPNPYKFSTLTEMHDRCPNCNMDFKREPGFYFGAAYVSYALTIALWVAVGVALFMFDEWEIIEFSFAKSPWTFVTVGLIAQVVMLPPIYRVSRTLWLAIVVEHD